MKDYKQYLSSSKWISLRKKARKRAKGKCELCGGLPNNVHHINYPKSLEEDCLNNLLVVCKKCHNKLHGIKNSNAQLMKVIKKRIRFNEENELEREGGYPSYIGFDMSKTHDVDNSEITQHNLSLLNLFKDYLDVDYISKHFDCWKGTCFFNLDTIIDSGGCNWTNDYIEKEFGGWCSKDILFWLIRNKGKYKEDKDGDGISKI